MVVCGGWPSRRASPEHTARLYVAHLQRFEHWLVEHFQADRVSASRADLRTYRAELARRRQPASVYAVSAPLHPLESAWVLSEGTGGAY